MKYDVLIYAKDAKTFAAIPAWAEQLWKRHATVWYGHYCRDRLIQEARRSRACLYLSTDDRGPLAAAEIALAGCPLIGLERGCPWVTNPGLGVRVRTLHPESLVAAWEEARKMSRASVKAEAERYFSTEETVKTVIGALERIAHENPV